MYPEHEKAITGEEQRTRNLSHPDWMIRETIQKASRFPENRSDPHFYNRTYNLMQRGLDDFRLFHSEVDKRHKMLQASLGE